MGRTGCRRPHRAATVAHSAATGSNHRGGRVGALVAAFKQAAQSDEVVRHNGESFAFPRVAPGSSSATPVLVLVLLGAVDMARAKTAPAKPKLAAALSREHIETAKALPLPPLPNAPPCLQCTSSDAPPPSLVSSSAGSNNKNTPGAGYVSPYAYRPSSRLRKEDVVSTDDAGAPIVLTSDNVRRNGSNSSSGDTSTAVDLQSSSKRGSPRSSNDGSGVYIY
ncbi:hypothetical protein BCR33DRAFT_849110 [Rhizoclosmatium globosum]|uniref:Uncharacterized protein n=1 Tax=Rhizoclosmatium globosum TaxID=329046 RepID=A0A1Y2CHG3_9FUNG|nr:hypothetical protein BCR33DRAFT_849110 [Rhizoclosmatium globosum]|eukprot:ORY46376.1 hypothetical protein BCR33DRAFT_849110 [Rhizoclosmatium globosum]